jgi:hypothetical protein
MRNDNSKGIIAQAVDDDGGGLLAGCGEFCRLGNELAEGSSTPVREERGGNSSGSIVYAMQLSSRTASRWQSHSVVLRNPFKGKKEQDEVTRR